MLKKMVLMNPCNLLKKVLILFLRQLLCLVKKLWNDDIVNDDLKNAVLFDIDLEISE